MPKILFLDNCYQCPHITVKKGLECMVAGTMVTDIICVLKDEPVDGYSIPEDCPLESLESITGEMN